MQPANEIPASARRRQRRAARAIAIHLGANRIMTRCIAAQSKKYIAYHVDLLGAVRASYGLDCRDNETARSKGQYFLRFRPTIEIWHGPRWIAAFTREEPPRSGRI